MPNFHSHNAHDNCVHDAINLINHSHHSHSKCTKSHDKSKNTLKIVMCITLLFAFVELAAAIWSGSLALMADFCHMLTDSAALLFALIMAHFSQKPATKEFSFGHGRADTIGAFVNALFMLGIIGFIVYEAIQRMLAPIEIKAEGMILVAVLGLIVNLISIYFLHGQESLNTKSALIHVMGDLLSSVATVIAGVVIYFTNYNIVDPILSLVVSLIILRPTWRLIKNSVRILMEGVPSHIDYEKVGHFIDRIEGVKSVHDLHIWTMNSNNVALSAHILIQNMSEWDNILKKIQVQLLDEYNIDHVTLQPEVSSKDFHCFNGH